MFSMKKKSIVKTKVINFSLAYLMHGYTMFDSSGICDFAGW